ncbi:DNA topoisomerase I [Luminiphilus syltensis NOR5-1B]|uniref:DNA topoisomerase 1 n=1 Tax=Luminiphilus syltensis NOR5-1B TaxID=565045 RepID=B8KYH4_9GAMM|nr:type I DNA topoisomerase [Luminiphilus syltensis]EED36866.1 DNA topoisomerase I [Luminiphilus syltensis NOR5-1B]
MGKSLVIVESPAKAKTINKYLGSDFIVKSSVGHIRDLPTSGGGATSDPKERAAQAAITRKMAPEEKQKYQARKKRDQLVRRMGVDPDDDWSARYEVLPGKEKVVNELKKLAKSSDAIYLATDLDREGEAIAWHLQEAIGGDISRYQRVVFNEITKKAIQAAFEHPGQLDTNRVNAQQARRFLDRVVGFEVSPLLWAKIARGLSAGRVQSVAVRLVVEREREIRAFVPEEYWEVHAHLLREKSDPIAFEVKRYQGKKFAPKEEAEAMAAVASLRDADYKVSALEARKTSSKPPAPFITSTLQQAASTRLGFSVKKTMTMAQRLYEAGYITYMRTDSTNLSADAIASCRDYIKGKFPAAYLPESPIRYSAKEGAQEAHEAIRPSEVGVLQGQLKGMERDAERLYELIWRQFVACQMTPARYQSTTVTVAAADYELTARGRIVEFDGYTRVQSPMAKKGDDAVLPPFAEGDVLGLKSLDPKQHFTKPPARFGEASLVKELEKKGIGRPSTYASIISTIQDRGYVRLENKRFYAEKMGDIVTQRLQQSFSDLLDYGFTAEMEAQLDRVADGELSWKQLLDRFYADFRSKLEGAAQPEPGGMQANDPTPTGIACEKCGRSMQIRTASTGVFLGCSGYALPPKERCKHTVNLIPGDEVVSADADDEAESRLLLTKHRCPKCNAAMDSYLIDEERKLHVCGNNPDCPGYEVETGRFKIKGYDGPIIECDKCGAEMQLKTGRFGKYFGCTAEECKNTRKLLRNGEVAPPKMDPVPMPELECAKVDDTYVLRDGASGMFLAASKFPKNRETRPPYVDEILPHRGEIDPKYTFLFDAPVKDDAGNRSQIRYSRKTKEQYVMTEVDGKATGWKAFFNDGRWIPEGSAKAKPKKKAAKAKAKKKSAKKSAAKPSVDQADPAVAADATDS